MLTPVLLPSCYCPPQDSLLRLKDYRQCFECSDVALNEAVQQMVNASEAAAKEEWVTTVTQLLLGIEQALAADSGGSILKESSSATGLVRLTSNLIQVASCSILSCPAEVTLYMTPKGFLSLEWVALASLAAGKWGHGTCKPSQGGWAGPRGGVALRTSGFFQTICARETRDRGPCPVCSMLEAKLELQLSPFPHFPFSCQTSPTPLHPGLQS